MSYVLSRNLGLFQAHDPYWSHLGGPIVDERLTRKEQAEVVQHPVRNSNCHALGAVPWPVQVDGIGSPCKIGVHRARSARARLDRGSVADKFEEYVRQSQVAIVADVSDEHALALYVIPI